MSETVNPSGWMNAPVSGPGAAFDADSSNTKVIDLRLVLDLDGAFQQYCMVNEQLAIFDVRLIEYEEAMGDAASRVKDLEAKVADQVADAAAAAPKEDKTLSSEAKQKAEVKRRLGADEEYQKWNNHSVKLKRAFARLQVAHKRLGREWQAVFFIFQRASVGKNPEKP